jgi:serine protease Do
MTNGIVSAIDRNVSSNGNTMTLIQTNAALNEGNSGGPLFNMYGQVVGITNMKMVNTYSEVTVEGIGFAIPSATAKAVSDQLIAGGTYVRPGIGITVGTISREDAEYYDLPDGLYISAVSEQSDAAAKGVRPGDILTHVNGVAVRKTDDVLAIRDAMQIGETMTLTIYRDGETFDVEIELYDLSALY